MGREIDYEKARLDLRDKFNKLAPFVKIERERLKSKKIEEPKVSDKCPERLKPLAERLVAIQKEKGSIKTEYLEKNDKQRIKDMSKLKNKLKTREAINLMVDNAYYVDNDVINARHIARLLEDFFEVYNKFYEQNNFIPLSALSKESQFFIKDMKTGLSKEEVIRIALEVYEKDFANINMVHHDYSLIPRRPLKEEDIIQIVSDLKEISAENGSLDVIFAQEYEPYLRKLCEKLKYGGYNFHTFIAEYTDLDYTMCFKCDDIVKAVKKMCESYKDRYGTTVGIAEIDNYLWVKVKAVKEILGVYTLAGALERMGIDADNYDTSSRILTEEELFVKELKLFKKLEQCYPDRHIPANSVINDDEIYGELLFLTKRRKFKDINDYLQSKGFSRDVVTNLKSERTMFLSERDLKYYGFFDGCETEEDLERVLAAYDIRLADPVDYIGYYRKLAFEGIDGLAKKNDKSGNNKKIFKEKS